jgi:DNA-binding transcriptional LysR family regulator
MDCGFVVSHADLRGLCCVSIADDPLGIVMEKGHRLARKRSLRIENIQNEPLILPSKERNPGFRTWFLDQCAAAHIKPHIVQEVSNPHEGSVLASQNVGIAPDRGVLGETSSQRNTPGVSALCRSGTGLRDAVGLPQGTSLTRSSDVCARRDANGSADAGSIRWTGVCEYARGFIGRSLATRRRS